MVGLRLAALSVPGGAGHSVVHLRRGDAELLPHPDLILEFGDRVGLLCPREHHGKVRAYFGDSIRGTAEFSYVSVGIGMALGVIVGLVPLPVPGIGTLSLGTAGGPLVVALLLGYLGRTSGLVWTGRAGLRQPDLAQFRPYPVSRPGRDELGPPVRDHGAGDGFPLARLECRHPAGRGG